MKTFLVFSLLLFTNLCSANSHPTNLVLVTIDGVRWQEVFYGIDNALVNHAEVTKSPEQLRQLFDAETEQQKREKLMPFLWQQVAKQGAIIGDRNKGSLMRVSNPWYFSYPGYNEIVTGLADPSIDSNDKVPNHNVSFLEWLQAKPEQKNNLAVFASWDVFPAIFNRQRSGLHINAGFEQAATTDPVLLKVNALQSQIPSPWQTVRFDAFTYQYAKAYVEQHKPRVIMLALGEPDDYAHNGNYDEYIKGINRADKLIAQLWETLQAIEQYKDNTYLIITTDHGRGKTVADWQHHSSRKAIAKKYPQMLEKAPNGIVGSEQVWLAVVGPKVAANGLVKSNEEYTSSQIAATALVLLGEDPAKFNPKAAKPMTKVVANFP
ncbi:alkaline phosphatase family protein (plasmid) [Pseudoalteromonas sp. T1lg65]|uniref:alkaline phosphatase family protein n=1 Tax=Pseudoalteromonas sp. T1lg65 TaxID=2077101 RepID=UPI003F7AEBBD